MISASKACAPSPAALPRRFALLQRLAGVDQFGRALVAGQVGLAAVVVGADPRQRRGVLAVIRRIGLVRLDAPPEIGDQRAGFTINCGRRGVDRACPAPSPSAIAAALAPLDVNAASTDAWTAIHNGISTSPSAVPPAALERPLADRLQLDDADARDVGPEGERVRRRAEPSHRHGNRTDAARSPSRAFLQELERDRSGQPSRAASRRRLVSVIGQQAALQRPQTVRRHVRMNLGAEQGGDDRRRHILLTPLEPAKARSVDRPNRSMSYTCQLHRI